MSYDLILASASPRRRQLLEAAGYCVKIVPADLQEMRLAGESPAAMVQRLAAAKAAAVAPLYPAQIVIAADTIVVAGEQVLGKPADLAAAESMLLQLSGRSHTVFTGVAIYRQQPPWHQVWYSMACVTFRQLSLAQIQAYFAKVNPLDKAGAYAIQEYGEELVMRLDGDRSTVIGLPMPELLQALRQG